MRRIVIASCVALASLGGSGVAHAHDPIILTSDQRTPADGPLLPDGTVSFALYGTLDGPGDTRGFRVRFAEGDPRYLSVLIPDLEPENMLADDDLPYLIVTDPAGAVSEIKVDQPVRFAEPFSGTNYVRLAELKKVAVAGTYEVEVSGASASRFTVSVRRREVFGTPVENVPNRDLGMVGVMEWYATAPTTTVVAVTEAPPVAVSEPAVPDDNIGGAAPDDTVISNDTVNSNVGTSNDTASSNDSGIPMPVVLTLVGVLMVVVAAGIVVKRKNRP